MKTFRENTLTGIEARYLNSSQSTFTVFLSCSLEPKNSGGLDRRIGKDEADENRYGRSGPPRLHQDVQTAGQTSFEDERGRVHQHQ